jgi:hypothetical protein
MYVLPATHAEGNEHLVLEGEYFVNPANRSVKVRAALNPEYVAIAYLPKDKRMHTGSSESPPSSAETYAGMRKKKTA